MGRFDANGKEIHRYAELQNVLDAGYIYSGSDGSTTRYFHDGAGHAFTALFFDESPLIVQVPRTFEDRYDKEIIPCYICHI